jgi:hypothetical protein
MDERHEIEQTVRGYLQAIVSGQDVEVFVGGPLQQRTRLLRQVAEVPLDAILDVRVLRATTISKARAEADLDATITLHSLPPDPPGSMTMHFESAVLTFVDDAWKIVDIVRDGVSLVSAFIPLSAAEEDVDGLRITPLALLFDADLTRGLFRVESDWEGVVTGTATIMRRKGPITRATFGAVHPAFERGPSTIAATWVGRLDPRPADLEMLVEFEAEGGRKARRGLEISLTGRTATFTPAGKLPVTARFRRAFERTFGFRWVALASAIFVGLGGWLLLGGKWGAAGLIALASSFLYHLARSIRGIAPRELVRFTVFPLLVLGTGAALFIADPTSPFDDDVRQPPTYSYEKTRACLEERGIELEDGPFTGSFNAHVGATVVEVTFSDDGKNVNMSAPYADAEELALVGDCLTTD